MEAESGESTEPDLGVCKNVVLTLGLDGLMLFPGDSVKPVAAAAAGVSAKPSW